MSSTRLDVGYTATRRTLATELGHVVDVRGEHDDGAALTQRHLGHGDVDGVCVTMPSGMDQHG
ncbi:hypothetical protein RM572_15725 [Streptomyces sp. DSM 42041]|uniref:Uncharacterized protein n=1 Tax=Streptomyces hazeniae TaxID=3075538 RepID=A0ABU2NX67_9ACTN|nr:hypothetical protein [Streptomyces sp. DSM 42041]MDT0380208.1 hypothetical protein [Streptomyces sp. DSM 42041]